MATYLTFQSKVFQKKVIELNGRTVRALKGRALAVPVDLRGLPKGTFTVAIITTEAHGHSWATVRRAQQKLGIKPLKTGKAWAWQLPYQPAQRGAPE